MDLMRVNVLLAASLTALLVFAADWLHRTDLRQSHTPVALCPNWDTLIIYRTPWEYANGRKTIREAAPPCLTLDEARTL